MLASVATIVLAGLYEFGVAEVSGFVFGGLGLVTAMCAVGMYGIREFNKQHTR